MPKTIGKELAEAVETLDVNPERVHWLYLNAAYEATGHNISQTARQLGMHRRTLQRQLHKKAPPAKRILPSYAE